MGVGGGRTAEDGQRDFTGVADLMGGTRRDADRIPAFDLKFFFTKKHPALSLRDMVYFLGFMMFVKKRYAPFRYPRLCKTLPEIPVNIRMHQLSNYGPILGPVWFDPGVLCFEGHSAAPSEFIPVVRVIRLLLLKVGDHFPGLPQRGSCPKRSIHHSSRER
jgi:hypothetical protein